MARGARSTVLTPRVSTELDRRIERAARRSRRTKSDVLREALHSPFAGEPPPVDPAQEARRQSLLVSGRPCEREAIEFIEQAADERGWR